jgi:S-adenosylmethionine:tRNA ribosyltransferase-isomerase
LTALSTRLFDYSLPPDLVAQTPAARRDQARLLVVDRSTRAIAHHVFSDLPGFLRPGDTLLRNTAAVLPARLRGRRPTGGRVECLLLAPAADRTAQPARPGEAPEVWRCLVKPGRKLPAGASFAPPGGEFSGEIAAQEEDGTALVRFTTPSGEPMTAIAGRLGEVPLPPYIERPDGSRRDSDRERYQTVYADPARPVAVAAPTAGLHFTPELLSILENRGVGMANLVLHVGLGTFRPISAPTIDGHVIHREIYELPVDAQRALFPPRSGRRIAVGTTTVRGIEDFLSAHDAPLNHAHAASTGIYLYPPCRFRGVDALITNFHQPRSTLLCLVAAFLTPGSTDGAAWLKEIYAEAILRRYRFFSYGDAMLIL